MIDKKKGANHDEFEHPKTGRQVDNQEPITRIKRWKNQDGYNNAKRESGETAVRYRESPSTEGVDS